MGKCKFNKFWLRKTDSNGYLISVWCEKQNDYSILCKCCSCHVSVERKGYQALYQHFESEKHKKKCNEIFGNNQMHFLSANSGPPCISSPMQLVSERDTACVAELLWTMKTVSSNYSFSSCQDIHEIFAVMFPTITMKDFSLSPKKMHYLLTDALCPYFRELMLEEVQQSYYTVNYDETTNAESKKELIITITFWSEKKNKIVCRHLEILLIGKADADTLCKALRKSIDNAGLSLNQLLMLGCDGPNVNKKVFNLLNEGVKEVRKSSLIDIGTCSLHVVHNAYLKGLQSLGEDAAELVTAIYFFFDGWPSRCEEFSEVQAKQGLPPNKFIKHTSSRWLTFTMAAERLLEQWNGVTFYFLKHIPSKNSANMHSASYKKIVLLLKYPSMKAQLYFSMSSAELFTRFTKKFQCNEPQIQNLFLELKTLIQCIVGRICKLTDTSLKTFDDFQILQESNLLPFRQIVLNAEVKEEVAQLTEKEQLYFLKNVQSHYISACKYLITKTPVKSRLVKALKCLRPEEMVLRRSCKDIIIVARALRFHVQEDFLLDEWKIVQLEDCLDQKHHNRIESYWNEIFVKCAPSGGPKYPTVTKVVKAALALSHGNADVERRFSVSRWALTEDRAAMSERTLNAIMVTKDALKEYNNHPHAVQITKKLISYAHNAYKRYNNYLEECKREQERKEKRLEEEEMLRKHQEDEQKQLEQNKATIDKIASELREKTVEQNQSRELAKQLFDEATDMLEKAIKIKDFQAIQLAEIMLKGVKTIREEENSTNEEIKNLRSRIEKRKDSMITSFFSKKQKL